MRQHHRQCALSEALRVVADTGQAEQRPASGQRQCYSRTLRTKALGVDLYLHQQHAARRALLQMSGVFAEFERAMLKERINAGLARARAQGKHLGRKRTLGAPDHAILKLRNQGLGMVAIGKRLRCGTARVQAVVKGAAS